MDYEREKMCVGAINRKRILPQLKGKERCGYSKGEQLNGLYFSGGWIPFTICPKTGEEIIIQRNN